MSSLSYLPPQVLLRTNPISSQSPQVILSFSFRQNPWLLQPHLCAMKNGSRGTSIGNQESYLLRKPVVSQVDDAGGVLGEDRYTERNRGYKLDGEENERWVDWEDQIFEDTVPLVGFVRMILHPARYESGDRLNPEHEKTILEKLLPFHPEFEKKVGCGIDYITVGYHPDFESSRCLFIVRKDGELVDFSYWKCIKGLIRKNYPSYADSFILRHFRRRRRHY